VEIKDQTPKLDHHEDRASIAIERVAHRAADEPSTPNPADRRRDVMG